MWFSLRNAFLPSRNVPTIISTGYPNSSIIPLIFSYSSPLATGLRLDSSAIISSCRYSLANLLFKMSDQKMTSRLSPITNHSNDTILNQRNGTNDLAFFWNQITFIITNNNLISAQSHILHLSLNTILKVMKNNHVPGIWLEEMKCSQSSIQWLILVELCGTNKLKEKNCFKIRCWIVALRGCNN